MSVFSDQFPPERLAPSEFKDFSLHMMDGMFVDLSQSMAWPQICREDRDPLTPAKIARKIAPRLTELGGTLTPKLLNKIIQTFKIHGPEIGGVQ
jgi:hypothetical protein